MSNFDLATLGEDFTQYERTVGEGKSEPMPVGFYSGVITRAEMKDTKSRSGKYLEVEFDITSPQEYTNRKFWDKFNIINSNQTAVKIAKEQLGDLLKALGFTYSPQTEELEGREVCMYLVIEPAKGDFAASNKCVKYLPTGSTEADYQSWFASKKGKASSAAQPSATANTQSPAPAKAAWKKRS